MCVRVCLRGTLLCKSCLNGFDGIQDGCILHCNCAGGWFDARVVQVLSTLSYQSLNSAQSFGFTNFKIGEPALKANLFSSCLFTVFFLRIVSILPGLDKVA